MATTAGERARKIVHGFQEAGVYIRADMAEELCLAILGALLTAAFGEREACAKLAEAEGADHDACIYTAERIAKEIRARH